MFEKNTEMKIKYAASQLIEQGGEGTVTLELDSDDVTELLKAGTQVNMIELLLTRFDATMEKFTNSEK